MSTKKANYNLLGSLNSFTQGRSGGDMVFAKVMIGLEGKYNSAITTSKLGQEFCEDVGVKSSRFIITTKEATFENTISTYIKRIVLAKFKLVFSGHIDRKAILLAGSDFLTETVCLGMLKLLSPKRFWIQHIFHVIPSERGLAHKTQLYSFWIIKHFADVVLLDNHLLKEDLVNNHNFNPNKITVNYPGIDYEKLRNISPTPLKYDAVCMGRLSESKGILDLVLIWSMVCKKAPKSKLALIGKGDENYTSQIRKEIKDKGLENNIDLLGFLPDDNAYKTIKSSKVFLSTSFEEGFGIAFLEAQALGIPVIAWDLPVFAEVFKSGMIKHKIKDFDSYVSSYFQLINNSDEYKLQQKKAIENASMYSWEKTVQKEMDIISNHQSP